MDIIRKLAEELNIRPAQAQAAVKLIDEGNTIPFIARYRKEATGALNDEVLRNLSERLTYLRNLEEKKESVIASIEEQGKLTEELRKQILSAETLVVVEDLYRPYRPKRRTRAMIARERGLEPLANLILLQKMTVSPLEEGREIYRRGEGGTYGPGCAGRSLRHYRRADLRRRGLPDPHPGTDREEGADPLCGKGSRGGERLRDVL